jgi:hypothetical protein
MGLSTGKVGAGVNGYSVAWTEEEIAQLSLEKPDLPGRNRAAINSARRRFGILVPRKADPRAAERAERRRIADERGVSVQELESEIRLARAAEREKMKMARAKTEAERAEKLKAKRARMVAARREKRQAAAAEKARQLAEVRMLAVASVPKPVPAVRRYAGLDLDPQVIGAAGRSRFGLGLVSTVQRTVPRDLWPNVKPRVIEDLVMSVVEGRCTPDDFPSIMPDVIQATMRRQFGGMAHG